MRKFVFELRIPDGTVVTTQVSTESWHWDAAFAAACARVEAERGIPPNGGIVCVGYRSIPDPFSMVA